jgi:hypothetical protein
MGLLRNLWTLLSDNIPTRMLELERSQRLHEEHVASMLDSMRIYSKRVDKRGDRAEKRGKENDADAPGSDLNPSVARLLARRGGRGNYHLGSSIDG